jgi:hypothetical protein
MKNTFEILMNEVTIEGKKFTIWKEISMETKLSINPKKI